MTLQFSSHNGQSWRLYRGVGFLCRKLPRPPPSPEMTQIVLHSRSDNRYLINISGCWSRQTLWIYSRNYLEINSLEWMVKLFDSQTVWCNLRFLFWNKYKWNKLKAHLHIYSILAGCGWEHQARKGKHKGSELLPSPPFSEAKLWLHLKHKD